MFNHKKFLRAVPAATLRSYFTAIAFPVPSDLDWDASENELLKSLGAVIDDAEPESRTRLLGDLQEANDLADEAGFRAILNACPASLRLVSAMQHMASFAERALWALWHHPAVFAKAQEIRFFDDNARKADTRRTRLSKRRPMSLAPADHDALARAVAAFYRQHEGSGDHCVVEVAKRHAEGLTQLTLYIEGLADSRPEFEDGTLTRRRSRPAMELALVYDAARGIVETAVRGGKKYHDMLLAAFVEHLLKVEVTTEPLLPQTFDLARLRRGVAVKDAARYGIERVRLKRLVFGSIEDVGATLVIESPARPDAPAADDLADRWFADTSPMFGPFQILQATIAIHFVAPDLGRPRRPLYLEFRRNGTIKWDKVSESERAMVETFVVEWGLVADELPPLAEAA
jgi:hypothetical protein